MKRAVPGTGDGSLSKEIKKEPAKTGSFFKGFLFQY